MNLKEKIIVEPSVELENSDEPLQLIPLYLRSNSFEDRDSEVDIPQHDIEEIFRRVILNQFLMLVMLVTLVPI